MCYTICFGGICLNVSVHVFFEVGPELGDLDATLSKEGVAEVVRGRGVGEGRRGHVLLQIAISHNATFDAFY